MKKQRMVVLRKGVYYFSTMREAHTYAWLSGHRSYRLVPYALGWAVQRRKSGPYLGPKGFA